MTVEVGRIFFAWVGDAETFSAATHAREDEQVLRLEIQEQEGEFATATVEIAAATVPSYLDGRARRAFISAEIAGVVRLVFDGRVLGYPDGVTQRTLTLEMIAQPADVEVRRSAFLDSLKTLPFFEPLASQETRADEAQEVYAARPEVLHWDRFTGLPRSSAIAPVAAGAPTIPESMILDGSLSLEIGEQPYARVEIAVSAEWEQQANGIVDITGEVNRRFPRSRPSTMTPEQLEGEWPKAGEALGDNSGYTVVRADLTPDRNPGFAFFPQAARAFISSEAQPSGDPYVDGALVARPVDVPISWYRHRLLVAAEYRQKREETVAGLLTNSVQQIGAEDGKSASVDLRLGDVTENRTYEIWRPGQLYSSGSNVAWGGSIWRTGVTHLSSGSFPADRSIGRWERLAVSGAALDPSATSYFATPRGAQSVVHAVLRGIALLQRSSRCVAVSFETDAGRALLWHTDMSLRVLSSRIPGGEAIGKITSLAISVDGDSGASVARVKIECMIGTTSNPMPGPAQPGDSLVLGLAVGYSTPLLFEPVSPGLMSSASYMCLGVDVQNHSEEQAALIRSAGTAEEIEEILGEAGTSMVVRMRSLAAYDTISTAWALAPRAAYWPGRGVTL